MGRVRERRAALDQLARQQLREHPEMSDEARWSMYCQEVRLAATRAEYDTWREILRRIE
jgi:hypothetical protein